MCYAAVRVTQIPSAFIGLADGRGAGHGRQSRVDTGYAQPGGCLLTAFATSQARGGGGFRTEAWRAVTQAGLPAIAPDQPRGLDQGTVGEFWKSSQAKRVRLGWWPQKVRNSVTVLTHRRVALQRTLLSILRVVFPGIQCSAMRIGGPDAPAEAWAGRSAKVSFSGGVVRWADAGGGEALAQSASAAGADSFLVEFAVNGKTPDRRTKTALRVCGC